MSIFCVLSVTLAMTVAPLVAMSAPAQAETGAVDRTPVMGWSSWSFLRVGLSAARIKGEAKALVPTGLAADGYKYVNLEKGLESCVSPWEKTRSLASIGGFKNFSRQWTGSTASGAIHASPEC